MRDLRLETVDSFSSSSLRFDLETSEPAFDRSPVLDRPKLNILADVGGVLDYHLSPVASRIRSVLQIRQCWVPKYCFIQWELCRRVAVL